jgi:hypothetical protein
MCIRPCVNLVSVVFLIAIRQYDIMQSAFVLSVVTLRVFIQSTNMLSNVKMCVSLGYKSICWVSFYWMSLGNMSLCRYLHTVIMLSLLFWVSICRVTLCCVCVIRLSANILSVLFYVISQHVIKPNASILSLRWRFFFRVIMLINTMMCLSLGGVLIILMSLGSMSFWFVPLRIVAFYFIEYQTAECH